MQAQYRLDPGMLEWDLNIWMGEHLPHTGDQVRIYLFMYPKSSTYHPALMGMISAVSVSQCKYRACLISLFQADHWAPHMHWSQLKEMGWTNVFKLLSFQPWQPDPGGGGFPSRARCSGFAILAIVGSLFAHFSSSTSKTSGPHLLYVGTESAMPVFISLSCASSIDQGISGPGVRIPLDIFCSSASSGNTQWYTSGLVSQWSFLEFSPSPQF